MSQKFFLRFQNLLLLVLTACASPEGVATTQPSSSDQVATVIAATMQAIPSSTPEPPSPEQDELTFRVVKQLGGTFDAVAVDGSTVYLGMGSRFATVDISNPSSPRLLWHSEVLTERPAAIALKSGMVYVRVGDQMLVYNVGQPAQPVLVGTLREVSGDLYAANDFVYALLPGNDSQQLVAVDISDPAHPAKVAQLDLSGTAAMTVSGDILYLVNGGGSPNTAAAPGTLQLIHRTQVLSQIALEDAWSYQVAVERDFAFVVANHQIPGGTDVLLVFDVRDPANSRQIARREMSVGGDIQVTNGSLFLLGRAFPHGGCPAGLRIVDVTDPASPQDPINFDPPQSCFNRFTVNGDTLAATSELGLEIYNVSDPVNITLASVLIPPDGFITADLITLNQSLAYLMTTAGRNRLLRLRVLDLANPTTPGLLNGAGFDLADPEQGGYGELEARGDRLYGLEQGAVEVDISDPANPRRITRDVERFFYNPIPAWAGNVLYTNFRNEQGTVVVDMSDPLNQVVVNTLPLEGSAIGLATDKGHLFVFSYSDFTRLQVFDISDPLIPVEIGRFEFAIDPLEQVEDFIISGDTMYAAVRLGNKPDGFKFAIYALDISDPSQPAEISRFELPELDFVNKLVPAGDTIYILLNKGGNPTLTSGIRALNVRDKDHPVLSGYFPFPTSDFAVDGDWLYLAAGDAGLLIVQVER